MTEDKSERSKKAEAEMPEPTKVRKYIQYC